MTIKEFAKLCNCNPQTLRYYDKEDLLKPNEVDVWTGYRYYSEEQALDFIKIKNLQEADFSIKEIKDLLQKSDEDVYRAFDKKIKEQVAKLNQIRKIQSTYLSEKQNMEAMVKGIRKKILESALEYDPEDEFGISKEYYKKLIDNTNELFELAIKKSEKIDVDFRDVETSDGSDVVEEEFYNKPLENDAYMIIYEKSGWEKTKEVLSELPKLDDGEYLFYFEVEREKVSKKTFNMAFCNILIGYALDTNQEKKLTLGCNCTDSKDDKNHFWLLKAK